MAYAGDPTRIATQDADEHAGEGRFGASFAGAQFMSNAEVAVVLEHMKRAEADAERTVEFAKSFDYVQKFSGVVSAVSRTEAQVNKIRSSLGTLSFDVRDEETDEVSADGLTAFEICSLSNLGLGDASEMIALIPSLARFEKEDLQKVLDTLEGAASAV